MSQAKNLYVLSNRGHRKTRSARTSPKLFDFISISLESLTSACPVKFFEEDKRSEFNWGPLTSDLCSLILISLDIPVVWA